MITALFRHFLIERPASKKTLSEWKTEINRSGTTLQERVSSAEDSEINRKIVSHIVGIERWGNNRLKVALGEPLTMDEYNDYRPAREATWQELKEDLSQARTQTVQLVGELESNNVDVSKTITHNQHGDLSIKGWVRYLNMHADFESRRLK